MGKPSKASTPYGSSREKRMLTIEQRIARQERVCEAREIEQRGQYVYALNYWSDIANDDAAAALSGSRAVVQCARIYRTYGLKPLDCRWMSLNRQQWARFRRWTGVPASLGDCDAGEEPAAGALRIIL